jgi:hypothetical protein
MFLIALVAGILGCMPLIPTIRKWLENFRSQPGGVRVDLLDAGVRTFNTACLALIFLWSVSLSAAGTYRSFIYFKF